MIILIAIETYNEWLQLNPDWENIMWSNKSELSEPTYNLLTVAASRDVFVSVFPEYADVWDNNTLWVERGK